MNERIKELLLQADINFDKDINEIDVCVLLPSDLEKFAELIVRECVDVIKKEVSMKYKDGSGETEEFMAGHYGGSLLARVMIAQHFGVKE